MGFLRQDHWSGLHSRLQSTIMSELSTLTRLSWVALPGMAHSFIELLKPLCHDKAAIHEGWAKAENTLSFGCVWW